MSIAYSQVKEDSPLPKAPNMMHLNFQNFVLDKVGLRYSTVYVPGLLFAKLIASALGTARWKWGPYPRGGVWRWRVP